MKIAKAAFYTLIFGSAGVIVLGYLYFAFLNVKTTP